MSTAEINVNPEALKAGETALRAELEGVKTLTIDSPAMALAVGNILIEQLRVLDVMREKRDSVTKPLYRGWKNTCALFDTGLGLQEEICAALKSLTGAWELQCAQVKEAATLEARAALATGDVATIERALTVVNAQAPAAKGVSTQLVWRVKRVAINLLPLAYHTWDAALVQAEAERQGTKGAEPPVIPGVIFEREADVTGRRK